MTGLDRAAYLPWPDKFEDVEITPNGPVPVQSIALPVGFLPMYWKPLALGAIVLVLVGFFTYQKLRIDYFKNQYEKEKITTQQLTNNNNELKEAIRKQNEALNVAETQTKDIKVKLIELITQIDKLRAAATATKIAALTKPAPKNDEEIVTLIRETIGAMKWED